MSKLALTERRNPNTINIDLMDSSDKDMEPIDGMRAILEYCREKGIVSHLFSNKTNKYIPEETREPYLSQEVEKLEVKDFFNNIVRAGEFNEDKPAPIACYAVFGGKDNLPKEKNDLVIVIGDAEADLKVAEAYKQAGVKTVSILSDAQKKYNGKTKPDYIIDSLNAIPIIIDNKKNGIAKVARIKMNQRLNKADKLL